MASTPLTLAGRPEAELSAVEALIARLPSLDRVTRHAVLAKLAATQLLASESEAAGPAADRRREIALAAAQALLASAGPGELLWLLTDERTDPEVRATIAAAAADQGTLARIVAGPSAARLGDRLAEEVVAAAAALSPAAPAPRGVERRLATLARLPAREARGSLVFVLAREPRVDVARAAGRVLASLTGPDLAPAILAEVRNTPAGRRGRLDLAEALLRVPDLRPEARADCAALLAESRAQVPEELRARAAALHAAALRGRPLSDHGPE